VNKKNLKILIRDLEFLLAEFKAEVYSDITSYHIDKDSVGNYIEINDDDGEPD
tara:strand:+ start:1214 stop:1372 length:159 start_codon:yes stop_codon:yes gene_type:complete